MLREDNDLLMHVGAGTPFGDMLRRYWHPIAMSSQVAEPDGPPLRTKLLGEPFVVFRDTQGRVGVLDEYCMHRGASLALGRNEEGGLRCIYHGWKFDVEGAILETPNHADCRFRENTKAPAYPVREQSGLVWAYIGPKELEPPFRSFEFDTVPEANRVLFRANVNASWLPLLEGGLDSSHVGVLHTNLLRPSWGASQRGETDNPPNLWDSLAPDYEIEDTDFGYHYCAFRDIPGVEVRRHARLTPFILPYFRMTPGGSAAPSSRNSAAPSTSGERPQDFLDGGRIFSMPVPMDDYETAHYAVAYNTEHPMDYDQTAQAFARDANGVDDPAYDPVTCDWTLDWENQLGQDRSNMKSSWSGAFGTRGEDYMMSVSLGEDWDRTKENLVPSDLAVVRMRWHLLGAIRRFQQGEAPPGVNIADMTKVVTYDGDIEVGQAWQGLVSNHEASVAAE
jgi:nitrite reductase/ring-hydroxylating ferredoxin subunit